MIPIALGVIVLVIISVLWAEGIDYMKENHPDYKGEDFFGEEEELKYWDVTVGDGLEGDEYTKQQRNIKAMKEEQKKILIDMMKLDEESGLYDDIEINRIALICKDCGDSLEDCTCIEDTIDFPKQEPKKVLTEEDIFNQKDIDAVTDYINKEQQKQHLIDMMESDEELELYDESREIKLKDVFNDEKKENIKKFIDEIENPSEPNKALIDAARRYIAGDNYNRYYDDFIEDAKWQQERMYSEEEVIKILYQFHYDLVNSNFDTKEEWFEQFKNK